VNRIDGAILDWLAENALPILCESCEDKLIAIIAPALVEEARGDAIDGLTELLASIPGTDEEWNELVDAPY